MDLPCTQLIEDDPPAAEDEQTRPPQSDTFEARVFGSLVGADADGRKERISRNPLQFPIRGGPNKIGRDPTQCQIVVENQTLSRVHAVLEVLRDKRGDPSYLIRDENSSNRSFLNGVQMRSGALYMLEGGEQLRFGEVRFVFQVSGQEDDDDEEEEEAEEDDKKEDEIQDGDEERNADEATLSPQTPSNGSSSFSVTPIKAHVSPIPETPMGPPSRQPPASAACLTTPVGIIPESPSITPNGNSSFITPSQPTTSGRVLNTPVALSNIFEQDTQAISANILDLPTQRLEASLDIMEADTQRVSPKSPCASETQGIPPCEAHLKSPSETTKDDQEKEDIGNGSPVVVEDPHEEDEDMFNAATQESLVDEEGGEKSNENPETISKSEILSTELSSISASPKNETESPTQPLDMADHPMSDSTFVGIEDTVPVSSVGDNDDNESNVSENLLAVCETDADVNLEQTASQGPSSSTPVKSNTSIHEDEMDDVATQILAEDDEDPPQSDMSADFKANRDLKDFSELMNSSSATTLGLTFTTAGLDQSGSALETTETMADTRIMNSMSSEGAEPTQENGPLNGDHETNDDDRESEVSSEEEIIPSSQLSTDCTNFNSIAMDMTKPVGKISSQVSSLSKDQIEDRSSDAKNESTMVKTIVQMKDEEDSRNLSPDIYDFGRLQGKEILKENNEESQGNIDRPDSEPLDLPCTQVLAEALKEPAKSEDEQVDSDEIEGDVEHPDERKEETVVSRAPRSIGKGDDSVSKKANHHESEEPLRRSSRATKRSTRLSSFVSDVPQPPSKSAKQSKTPTKSKATRSSAPIESCSIKTPDARAAKTNVNTTTNDEPVPGTSSSSTEPVNSHSDKVKSEEMVIKKASVSTAKTTAERRKKKKQQQPTETTKSKSTTAAALNMNATSASFQEVGPNIASNPEVKNEIDEIEIETQGRRSKRLLPSRKQTKEPKVNADQSTTKPASFVELKDDASSFHRKPKAEPCDEISKSNQVGKENGCPTPTPLIDQHESPERGTKATTSRKRTSGRTSSTSTLNQTMDESKTLTNSSSSTNKRPKRSSLRSSGASSASVAVKEDQVIEEEEDSSRPRSSQRISRQLRNQASKQQDVSPKSSSLQQKRKQSNPLVDEAQPIESTSKVKELKKSATRGRKSNRGSPPNNSKIQNPTDTQESSSKPVSTSSDLGGGCEVKRASRRKANPKVLQAKEANPSKVLEMPNVEEKPAKFSTRSLRRSNQALQTKQNQSLEAQNDPTSKSRTTVRVQLDTNSDGSCSFSNTNLKRASKRMKSQDQQQDSLCPSKKKTRNVATLKRVMERRESTSSVESVSLRQRDEIKVMFTGYEDTKDQKIVCDLGGTITESLAACTVLVTDKIRRTAKFLCMVARGMPIVSPLWLHSSKECRTFQDPWLFLITDRDAEKKWDFVLQTTLRNAKTQEQLLSGFKIYATKSVLPSGDQLKEIVESAGGQVLRKLPKRASEQVIVIACAKDHEEALAARERGFQVSSNEIILTGFLRHKLDFRAHQLKI